MALLVLAVLAFVVCCLAFMRGASRQSRELERVAVRAAMELDPGEGETVAHGHEFI